MGTVAAEAGDRPERKTPAPALLRDPRDEIPVLAAGRDVSNIRIPGSVARGDTTPDVDPDLRDAPSFACRAGRGLVTDYPLTPAARLMYH